MILSEKSRGKTYIPEIVLFLAIAAFLFLRAPYGYFFDDEPFLLDLAQRLSMGDRLIVDEWNATQNTGLLILPVYVLVRNILGSTEGIMLMCRYCYCICYLAALVFVYRKLRFCGRRLLFPSMIYLALFSPMDYMTLSYTSISLMAVLALAAVIFSDYPDENKAPLKTGLLSGFLMSIVCLCYPYAVLPLLPALVIALITGLRKHSRRLLRFTAGVFAAAGVCLAAYLCYLLCGCETSSLPQNIRMILTDPTHKPKNIFSAIPEMLTVLCSAGRSMYILYVPLCLAVILFRKRLKKLRVFVFAAGLLIWAYSVSPLLFDTKLNLNCQVKDTALPGLLAYLLLEKRDKRLFFSFYGVSLAYAYSAYMSSNTGIIAVSQGMSTAGFAGMIFIAQLASELKEQYPPRTFRRLAALGVVSLMLIFQIGLEIRVRLDYTYWDDHLYNLTQRIESGPGKGIITTEENAEKYSRTAENFAALMDSENTAPEGKTLMTTTPWVYLLADMRCGGYSVWTLGDETVYSKQQQYCRINGKEMPDYIFLENALALSGETPEGYDKREYGGSVLLIKRDQ